MMRVAAPMETDIKTVSKDMTVAEAVVHRLFVERDGELVGMISQSDIVRAVATERT